jgi:hypothetical protein
VPASGFYNVKAQARSTINLSATQRVVASALIGGVNYFGPSQFGTGGASSLSGSVDICKYLTKGATIKIQFISSVAGTLSTTAGENYISIHRVK